MAYEGLAAILNEPGQTVAIEEITIDPPGPGEVLVKLAASGARQSMPHRVRSRHRGRRDDEYREGLSRRERRGRRMRRRGSLRDPGREARRCKTDNRGGR